MCSCVATWAHARVAVGAVDTCATILTRIRATVTNTWQKLQLLLEQQYISTTSTAEWQVFIKCLTCVTDRPGVSSWTHANIAADAVKACATIFTRIRATVAYTWQTLQLLLAQQNISTT